MRFEINNESPKEPILILHLTRLGDDIYLRGTELNGEEWNLFWFSSDGIVHRCTGIKDSSGLELDDRGQLIIR